MRKKLTSVHVLPAFSKEWGGPFSVIQAWMQRFPGHGIEIKVVAGSGRQAGLDNATLLDDSVHRLKGSTVAPYWTGHCWGFDQPSIDLIRSADILHIHELWHYPAWQAFRIGSRFEKRIVITVHGELDTYSFQRKALRKWFYWNLIQRKMLQRADLVHCITDAEAGRVRELAPGSNCVVIHNGIEIPDGLSENLPLRKHNAGRELGIREDESSDVIGYLGRLHHKKGIDLLIASSIQLVRKHNKRLTLVLAGNDEGQYIDTLRALAADAPPGLQVKFLGHVTGDLKERFFAACDVIAIPSRSDVRTVVALEAALRACALVITHQCQFPEIVQAGGAWVCSPNVESLSSALSEALSDSAERARRGLIAKSFVSQHCDIKLTCSRMACQYRDLADKLH